MIDTNSLLFNTILSKRLHVLFLGLLLIALPKTIFSQDCAISNEITIVSQGSSNVILNVEGLINNNLSTNQSLCGVRLVFKHDMIENVRITLVSPSGQRVTLVGPGRVNSNPSPFITWNIAFVPCGVPAAPDSGISGVFDNGEPWGAFTNYTGIYHPFDNCLEDFNTGSANGSWLLEIENLGDVEGVLEFFQLIFCDSEGSVCSECFLFAGNFNFSTPGGIYTFCESDPSADLMDFKLDQDSLITSSQDFTFVYSRNDTIIKFSESPNEISDLSPGTYSLCGLAFQLTVEDTIINQTVFSRLDSLIDSRSICADFTEDCITLRILEIQNHINIDTTFCDGDSISFFGEVFYDDVDTTVIVSNLLLDRCDSLIVLSAKRKTVVSIIDNTTDVSQCGNSVFLNGNSSSTNIGQINNFEWTTNDGFFEISLGPIAEVSSGGTYYLSAQSDLCSDLDSVIIQQVDTFEWNINTVSPECFLDSFIINVSSVPNNVDYVFNGPSNVEVLNNQAFYTYEEGLYEIQANFGSCKDSFDFNLIHQASELTLDVSSTIITCTNDSSEIVINTNAINSTFELLGPLTILTLEDTLYSHLPGEYDIIVIDEDGCEISQSINIVEQREDPDFTVQDISRLCNETIPSLSALINSPFDSILWIGPSSFRSNRLDELPIDSGMYMLTVFGSNGCELTKDLNYSIENVPFSIDITYNDIDCENLTADICYDNPNNFSINWIFENTVISDNSCFMATQPGQYFAEVTDVNGCIGMDSILINDLSNPIDVSVNASPSNLKLSCSQETITLEARINGNEDNLTFEWFDTNSLLGNLTSIVIEDPITVELIVTDTVSKCFYSESIIIEESFNPFQNFEIDLLQPVCEDESGSIVEISPLMLNQYDIFLNGNMIFDYVDLQMLVPGDYTLELVDENSCIADTTFTIENGRILELEIGEDLETVFGVTISIDGQLNISENEVADYMWSNMDSLSCNNCLTPSFSAHKNEEIILKITDNFGCEVSDTLKVIIDNEVKYFVPNVFSPNDDGDNDNLALYLSDGILKVFDFRVMDRWGNLVLFRPEILNESDILVWDGFSNGKPVVQGVYVYVAKLLLIDGTETLITGNVTVIR